LKTKILSFALKNPLAYYNGGVEVVNSKVVGLAPGLGPNFGRMVTWDAKTLKVLFTRTGLPDFSWSKHTKTGKIHITNDHKL
jgi:hypothetical protein